LIHSFWLGMTKPVAAVRAVVTTVLRNRTVKDALHGVWLGHPLHPGAAQFTAGSLLSASVLDAVGPPVGGGRSPSTFLIAAGLATAPLTAAAGWLIFGERLDHLAGRNRGLYGFGGRVVAFDHGVRPP